MKYKVTLDCRCQYIMVVDALDIGKAAIKAEQIFRDKANYNDIESMIGEAIRVEKDKG